MWLSEWLKKRKTAPSESANKRLRILAVSISLDDIFLLEYLGGQHGWETKFAGSPQDAFKLASYGDFDLILCDRNQSGISLARGNGSPGGQFAAQLHPSRLSNE